MRKGCPYKLILLRAHVRTPLPLSPDAPERVDPLHEGWARFASNNLASRAGALGAFLFDNPLLQPSCWLDHRGVSEVFGAISPLHRWKQAEPPRTSPSNPLKSM